ncbi:MAG TPA: transporter substrate-binding domain-containing protein, partial [Candidatus Babeliales bacterium]|nr:transporter substrate-binding domain-containing protein [Candidatus Babeliales bacterium]
LNRQLLILTLCCLSAGTALYFYLRSNQPSPQPNTTASQPPLIVGTASGYAPFVSINAQGQYEGFDINVAQALAQQLNRPLEMRDLGAMAPLFLALEQGTIDVIIWGLSITPERLQKVAMVHYWGDATKAFPLIFWQQIPTHVKTINDMANLTVCVEPTSVQDSVLSKYPCINRKFTERVDDALLNIKYGKAAAAFVEPAIAQKFKRKYPEIQLLNVPLAPIDQIQGLGIAVKSSNLVLIKQIQAAVQKLTATGALKNFAEQWGIVD